MKVLVTNTVALNGGDAAILLSIIEMLRAELGKETEIIVFGSQPKEVMNYYPSLDVRAPLSAGWATRTQRGRLALVLWLWNRGLERAAELVAGAQRWADLREYLTADLIVSTGGTYLVEHYRLEPRLFDFEVSLRAGRPLAFFTQSLGPFEDTGNRARLRPIFEDCLLILVRDQRSRSHVEALGIDPAKIALSADAAFSMAKPAALQSARGRRFPEDSPLRVGISVRSWSHFKKTDADAGMALYREAVSALVTDLVADKNAEVRFLSTCQGIPAYWTDDSKLARTIVNGLDEATREHVTVDDSFHSPEELISVLGDLDVVVATRMHVAILSLVAGTPVFPIAYEFKTSELFERLGVGEWVQDIGQLTGKTLSTHFSGFLEALPGLRAELFERVEDERVRARAAASTLARTLREAG
jgi:colanic acid/amylovoran biosynthesis protein